MDKNGNITIGAEDFIKGIARSPYLGIASMVNLDIHSQPGVLKIAYKLEKESADTVVERVNYLAINPDSGITYGLDSDGQVYSRSTSGTWDTISGNDGGGNNGLFVWKDYLFAVGIDGTPTQDLNVYGPLSGSASWDLGWEDIAGSGISAGHSPSLTYFADDAVYVATDNEIGTVEEVDGQNFDPTSGATYSVSTGVMVANENTEILSITEQLDKLVMGTEFGSSNTDGKVIYWNPNKSGTDAADADYFVRSGTDAVYQTTNLDNLIWGIAGNRGQFFKTDGVNLQTLFKINDLTKSPDTNLDIQPEAIDAHDGGVLFGVGKVSATDISGDNAIPNVWYYKNDALTSFTTSQGEVDGGMRIGAIKSLSADTFIVSWENLTGDNNYGVDVSSDSERYQNYSAYFESKFYRVGRNLRGKTYQYVGFKLAKNLSADQGVRVKYRENIDDEFTTLGTWDFATYGAINGYEDKANMPTNLENVQFRVELTTGDSDTTPELQEVYIM